MSCYHDEASVCPSVRLSVRPSTFHINRFISHNPQPISVLFILSDKCLIASTIELLF